MYILSNPGTVAEQARVLLDIGLDGVVSSPGDGWDVETASHAGEVLGKTLR